jgi:O-antigen/teichoic acid export membrane protein
MNEDPSRRPSPKDAPVLTTEHLKEGLKKRALVGASFSVLAQTLNYGIQTVGTIILARILTPEDFGLVSMSATFCLLVQNYGINGFREAIIQREDLTEDHLKKLFWVNLSIMIALTLFFIAISPAIAWFFGEASVTSISKGMALSIFFSGLGTCHLALLSRNMKFNLFAAAQVLAALFSTVLAVGLALGGVGIWALVLRWISLPFVTTVFAWIFCRWMPGIPAKGTSIREILGFGNKTYGNFVLTYIRNNLDKVLVGKAFGKTPLGHYDRSSQLSSVLPNQLTIALSGVGIATLSRLVNDPPRYRTYVFKAISVLSFIGFPGSVLFTLLGKDIILVLLGDRWSIAGDIFAALGPGIGAFVIISVNTWLHLSLGRADRLLRWGFVFLGASLVSYSLGLLFGPVGVAIAYSAMFYLLLIPALAYAGKPAGLGASFFIGILWRYWTAAFISGASFWLTFSHFAPAAKFYAGLVPLLRIGFGSIGYTVFYLAFIAVLFGGWRPLAMVFSLVKDTLIRQVP